MSDAGTTPYEHSFETLAIARVTIDLTGEARERAGVVELDAEALARGAQASEALAGAGWRIRLCVTCPHVELIAEKRFAILTAATSELVALGVEHGMLYFDSPDRVETIYEVDLTDPGRAFRVGADDPDDAPLGRSGVLAAIDLHARAGALLLARVPAGTDAEALIEALERTAAGSEAIAAVTAVALSVHEQEPPSSD